MPTRWFRRQYDAEYERYMHPERHDPVPEWEVNEVSGPDRSYEPNPTTGYDPRHDWEMRFILTDWGELVEHPDTRFDPVEILPRDMVVSTAVCERLRREPEVDLSKIGIYSEGGVVTLRGTVGSVEAKRRVLNVAAKVPEVVRVVDRLQVAKAA